MKIICIGRNYVEHAQELNNEVPDTPLFFMKPETAILRPGNDFFYPDFSKSIHYEAELVVRINKVGRHIQESFAHKYYNEIGLGIDFTARDLQSQLKAKGHPWEAAKAFDHSAAIGHFVHKDSVIQADGSIPFSLKINDEVRQKSTSKLMIFSIDHIIAYVSRFVSLKIGDLIFTGTPKGVGEIQIGDHLQGFIGEQSFFDFYIR